VPKTTSYNDAFTSSKLLQNTRRGLQNIVGLCSQEQRKTRHSISNKPEHDFWVENPKIMFMFSMRKPLPFSSERGTGFGRVCMCVFVCLSCSCSNFWKHWPRNFIL